MRVAGKTMAIAAVLSWTTASFAATVNVASGTVSINGGRPVGTSAAVKAGDAVTAGPSGRGTIVYDNGCAVTVEPGTTVTVMTDEQCSLALGPQGFGSTGLVVGAVGVAGLVGIGIALSQKDGKDDKKPASP